MSSAKISTMLGRSAAWAATAADKPARRIRTCVIGLLLAARCHDAVVWFQLSIPRSPWTSRSSEAGCESSSFLSRCMILWSSNGKIRNSGSPVRVTVQPVRRRRDATRKSPTAAGGGGLRTDEATVREDLPSILAGAPGGCYPDAIVRRCPDRSPRQAPGFEPAAGAATMVRRSTMRIASFCCLLPSLSATAAGPRSWEELATPESEGLWVRPAARSPAQPVWGHADGLRVGLAPMPGPRGLLRIYAPYLGHPPERMINFIAVEPIVVGHGRRGFSEAGYPLDASEPYM